VAGSKGSLDVQPQTLTWNNGFRTVCGSVAQAAECGTQIEYGVIDSLPYFGKNCACMLAARGGLPNQKGSSD